MRTHFAAVSLVVIYKVVRKWSICENVFLPYKPTRFLSLLSAIRRTVLRTSREKIGHVLDFKIWFILKNRGGLWDENDMTFFFPPKHFYLFFYLFIYHTL